MIRWRVFVAIIAPRDEPLGCGNERFRTVRESNGKGSSRGAMTATYLRLAALVFLRRLREAVDALAVGGEDQEIGFAFFVFSEGHDGT